MVAFPGSYRAVAAQLLGRTRPEAWLRRRFLRHALNSGWAAVQRRDFELMLVRYAPDVVFDADAGLQALGVPGSAHGREEMARALVEILEVFDRFELVPTVAVDLGDSLIVLGGSRLHGRGSGIEFETEVAQLLRIERGLVARERDFFSWDDALHAAALDPEALDLPR
jgi:ketosteroid isomerase-like protein